jgi:hypothetical protein
MDETDPPGVGAPQQAPAAVKVCRARLHFSGRIILMLILVMLGCRFDQPAVAAPSDEIKTLRKQLTQKARKWPERALTVLFGRG